MQLSKLSLADPLAMNWHSKRSLLQLHILFLSLFIEPYRNGLVNLERYRLKNNVTLIALEDLEALRNIEEQCVLAARRSARIASLLQTDNMIRSRCWVSVYVNSSTYRSIITNTMYPSDISASLAVLYFCSALRRNYSSLLEKKSVRTYCTHLHI